MTSKSDEKTLLQEVLGEKNICKDYLTFWEEMARALETCGTEEKKTQDAFVLVRDSDVWGKCIETGGGICSSHVLFSIKSYFKRLESANGDLTSLIEGRLTIIDEEMKENIDRHYSLVKFDNQYDMHLMECKVHHDDDTRKPESHYALCFKNRIGTDWYIMDVSLGRSFHISKGEISTKRGKDKTTEEATMMKNNKNEFQRWNKQDGNNITSSVFKVMGEPITKTNFLKVVEQYKIQWEREFYDEVSQASIIERAGKQPTKIDLKGNSVVGVGAAALVKLVPLEDIKKLQKDIKTVLEEWTDVEPKDECSSTT